MISQIHRFHGHASLSYLHSKGKTVRGGSLSLKFTPNNKRSHYRLAVIVSKKVSKSAVVRNRIRRRLYESVRILYTSTQAYDMAVFVYDNRPATLPADKIVAEMTKLLQKSGIVIGKPTERVIVEAKETIE